MFLDISIHSTWMMTIRAPLLPWPCPLLLLEFLPSAHMQLLHLKAVTSAPKITPKGYGHFYNFTGKARCHYTLNVFHPSVLRTGPGSASISFLFIHFLTIFIWLLSREAHMDQVEGFAVITSMSLPLHLFLNFVHWSLTPTMSLALPATHSCLPHFSFPVFI